MRVAKSNPSRRDEPARPGRHAPRAGRWPAAAALVLLLTPIIGAPVQAQTFRVLYRFGEYPDGNSPLAGLLMDAAGNLYGTTRYGGSQDDCSANGAQCGTVFKLDTNGVETVLYNFTGPDGANPTSNLIMDANGDLYGTTEFGGNTSCSGTGYAGCGVVFKLSRDGKEAVLHRFTGGDDGAWPWRGLVMDARGALYGTTNTGGKFGAGVAFKLVGKRETVLHVFCSKKNCNDGDYITSGLIIDAKGNLYGTAFAGGIYGGGLVFKLVGKHETALHAFDGPPDGAGPFATLFMDRHGDLYGTTFYGGTKNYSVGTVFGLSPDGKERVLHKFQINYNKQRDGYHPETSVVQDECGNVYGTAGEGGIYGGGVLYEITTDGKEKILHAFCSEDHCSDGGIPNDLIIDAKGNLYGTTYGGGINGNGVIFMITP